ncbi:MAG: MaoC family dehydratase N-terminal domain-containing protein [Pseudomonadota bacterium]
MTALTLDPGTLGQWIGRTEAAQIALNPETARRMQVTLDSVPTLQTGASLPPLWHWLYLSSDTPTSGLGRDGHTSRGGFLPPVALPRRMWAGGDVVFHAPLRLGQTVSRQSTVRDIQLKQGRSGQICLVTVRHTLDDALTEDHQIVYRSVGTPGAVPHVAPPDLAPRHVETVVPNIPLLFRYSALTFNSHRIHYDLDYCRGVEGYPGLVVHGPLVATWLADLATRVAKAPLKRFTYRATAPLFHNRPAKLCAHLDGPTLILWAAAPDGTQAMRATARFA